MLKTKRVLQIFLFLAIFREKIYGREFIRCPDLEGIHRDAASFLDFILSSRLLCGSKCTEHKDQCWSYAWNGATKQCMLFSDRCSKDFITDQHQNNWVHYKVQGKVCKKIQKYITFMSFFNLIGVNSYIVLQIYETNIFSCKQCIIFIFGVSGIYIKS